MKWHRPLQFTEDGETRRVDYPNPTVFWGPLKNRRTT